VEPYLAELDSPTPYPLPQKLDQAIASSSAVLVFLTRNVESDRNTWDVVNWEITSAYDKKKPIYVFVEKSVNVPMMVNYITVYATYNPLDKQSLDEMVRRVGEIASDLKKSEDIAKGILITVSLTLGILGGIAYWYWKSKRT
jgi:hypothetical protein